MSYWKYPYPQAVAIQSMDWAEGPMKHIASKNVTVSAYASNDCPKEPIRMMSFCKRDFQVPTPSTLPKWN